MKKTIGVLAVQGSFAEHIEAVSKLGVEYIELRQKSDLIENKIDGLILPGGESSVMGKLINELDMFDVLKQTILDGIPVLGTCAGLILLSKKIVSNQNTYLSTMDITVKQNAYGRQLGSFHTCSNFEGIGEVPMTFIRAPYIESVSDTAKVLAIVDDKIVAARQNNMIATSFHPELTSDLRIHRYFLDMIS